MSADAASAARIERHRAIEAELRGLGDGELVRRLSDASLSPRGHGALSALDGSAPVFVKLLPMTDFELEPEHRHSTANIFGLPTYYQYRLGGFGLGAWRELKVHRLTNEWVLSGQGSHFPLLHHWRTLPIAPGRMDNLFESWGDDAAIRRRVSSIDDATWSLVLFLEHLPQTLGQSMRDRLTHDPDPIAVVRETQAVLLDILAFTGSQGLLHMDAHFENVLVDGSGGLFLGDHGLAISRTFELDGDEREFFKRHETFDRCTAFTSLVHAVVARYDARPVWREALRELIDGTHRASAEVSADLRAYLVRRGPLALAMGDFYRRLTADLRTEYPAASLQAMLDGA